MSYMGIDIADSEMRRNIQIVLNGKVEELKALLQKAHSVALPVATINWDGQYQLINSYQLACALYDTYAYDDDQKWFKDHNILEILNIHKRLLPSLPHVDYSKIGFISWNDGDYYDESDTEDLINAGVRRCDIDLTNFGMMHNEKQVIGLLQNGASPYFKDVTDEVHLKDGKKYWYYGNLASLLSRLDNEWCDQWFLHGLSSFEENVAYLDDEDLCRCLCCLFNAGASARMLYIIDKYIRDDIREKGMELLESYNNYCPILRYKPDHEEI